MLIGFDRGDNTPAGMSVELKKISYLHILVFLKFMKQ